MALNRISVRFVNLKSQSSLVSRESISCAARNNLFWGGGVGKRVAGLKKFEKYLSDMRIKEVLTLIRDQCYTQ